MPEFNEVYIGPPKPETPPRDLSWLWDTLAVSGIAMLAGAGWWVMPPLGLAVLGVALLVVGVIGSRGAVKKVE